jgi:hypothetical protein
VSILFGLDISSISAIIAAAGVLVGVVLAVLQLRDFVRTRHTDLVMRLYTTFGSGELQNAYQKLEYLEFDDYADFSKRYANSIAEVWAAMSIVGVLFEGIGVLYERKLISIDLVNALFGFPIKQMWEKIWTHREGREGSEQNTWDCGVFRIHL